MPRGDATGPLGQGSMTGRGLGTCNPNGTSKLNRSIRYGAGIGAGIGLGLGLGRRFGRQRGFRQNVGNFVPTDNQEISKEDRIAFLKNQLTNIQNELDSM